MPKFLKIFGNFEWYKKEFLETSDFKFLKQTKIVPPNIAISTDDCIKGSYKDVDVDIIEIYVGKNALLFILFLAVFFIPLLSLIIAFAAIPLALVTVLFDSLIISSIIFCISLAFILFGFVWLLYRIIKYFWLSGKFKGVLINLNMPKSFFGHTFIYENAFSSQALQKSNKKGYEKVQLEDIEFLKDYTVYSTDQIEARYILTPTFIERLKNISLAFNTKYLRISFQNNKMILLAACNKDLFVMGNPFKDTDKQTFDTLFDELYSIFCLVDELKLQKHI